MTDFHSQVPIAVWEDVKIATRERGVWLAPLLLSLLPVHERLSDVRCSGVVVECWARGRQQASVCLHDDCCSLFKLLLFALICTDSRGIRWHISKCAQLDTLMCMRHFFLSLTHTQGRKMLHSHTDEERGGYNYVSAIVYTAVFVVPVSTNILMIV